MKIVFKHKDGNICERFCLSKEIIEKNLGKSLSDDEYLKHHMDKLAPGATSIIQLDDEFYMGDYFFRDAWSDLNPDGTVTIDLDKAKLKVLKLINHTLKKLINEKHFLIEINSPYDDMQKDIHSLIGYTKTINDITVFDDKISQKLKDIFAIVEKMGINI